jgi:hypothetical protein
MRRKITIAWLLLMGALLRWFPGVPMAASPQQVLPMLGSPVAASSSSHTFTSKAFQATTTSCSPTCTITPTVQAIGDAGLIQVWQTSGSADYISTSTVPSGGGTWYVPSGAGTCQNSNINIGASSCAWTPSLTSTSPSIVITMTASTTYRVIFWDVPYSGTGSAALDTQNSTVLSAGTNPTGQALTLTGSSEAVFQMVGVPTGPASAITSPYQTTFGEWSNQCSFASAMNISSGAAPTWTDSNSEAAIVVAIAFK